ncbi:MAG: molybdopterin cofactor-binding domain-containing protein, partial [Alphaproteobacteria bacterium]
TNRPKVAAYRAPGAPISEYGVECVIDELAKTLGIDPVDFRLKNAAKQGTHAAYGPKFGPIGMVATLEAAKAHAHYSAPLGPNQGRGVASGFWFNIGGETSTSVNVHEDGTVTLMLGTPDVAGGSRAAMAMMVAEDHAGQDLHDRRRRVLPRLSRDGLRRRRRGVLPEDGLPRGGRRLAPGQLSRPRP